MIKFLAALIIITGFWCIGQSKNARLRLRISLLRRFLDGLQAMENEIRGLCAPLPLAFEKAAGLCPLFGDATRYAEEEDAATAFSRAVETTDFDRDEAEILASFAAGLSAEDPEGQLRNIAHCRTRLTALCNRLEEDAGRLGRLYSGSGALAGVLLVILLL